MALATQSLPSCPTNSLSRHPQRPDGQPTVWSPQPTPTTLLKGPESAFAQTQTELQPQRLVLSPGSFFSLSPYLQVPTARSKETQTLYTHLLKLLLHGLLLLHPCFHDRLKGKRLWVDQKPRAFV